MGLGVITTRAYFTRIRPYEDVDGNRQGRDDGADEVARRSEATDGEVSAEFNAAGAAGQGREGFVEGGAAGLDEERCPVMPGMTRFVGVGQDAMNRCLI